MATVLNIVTSLRHNRMQHKFCAASDYVSKWNEAVALPDKPAAIELN